MRKGNKQKGFTLIELVVVIAVLAILAGVAVPKFLSITADANKAAEKADVGAIRSGVLSKAVQDAATSKATSITYPSITVSDTGKTAFTEILEASAALDLYERGWRNGSGANKFAGPTKTEYTYDTAVGTFR